MKEEARGGMTEQAVIREGVETILSVLYDFHLDGDAYAKEIIQYLHSKGVVRKVDRELPENQYKFPEASNDNKKIEWRLERARFIGYSYAQGDMVKAGYVAVEDLI